MSLAVHPGRVPQRKEPVMVDCQSFAATAAVKIRTGYGWSGRPCLASGYRDRPFCLCQSLAKVEGAAVAAATTDIMHETDMSPPGMAAAGTGGFDHTS
jgi:hypothetical protein